MNITSVITIIGIVQGLFILTLLVPKVKVSRPAFYAILLMTVFVVDLITFLLHNNSLLDGYWYLTGLSESTWFLYGPVLYLYVSSVLYLEKLPKFKKQIIHFVPAAIVFVLTSRVFLRDQTYAALERWKRELPELIEGSNLGSLLIDHLIWYAHAITYFLLCLSILKGFKSPQLKTTFNGNQVAKRIHFRWVGYLIIGYLAFPVIGISILAYNLVSGNQADSFSLWNYLLVFHIFGISYIGFANQGLLLNPGSMLKYRNSSLDEKKRSTYLSTLTVYFENQSPYLNANLSLKQVGKELNISPHSISQVINDQYGHGFNDFVNYYRIELAKKFILAPEKQIFTLEAIANEVGFKSKPTFNTAFKKKEGITPSEYRKKHL